jgi:hypothetical protein
MIRFSDGIKTREIEFDDDEYFMDNNHVIVNKGGAKNLMQKIFKFSDIGKNENDPDLRI